MIDPNDEGTAEMELVPGDLRNAETVMGMPVAEPHGVVFPPNASERRPRGRPSTGKALSNADRQRAYRERQKAQRNENSPFPRGAHDWYSPEQYEEVRLIAVELEGRCKRAEKRVKELEKELDEARLLMADLSIRNTMESERNKKLEQELASRNENPAHQKAWRVEFLPKGKKQWIEATKGQTFTTKRNAERKLESYLDMQKNVTREQLRVVPVT